MNTTISLAQYWLYLQYVFFSLVMLSAFIALYLHITPVAEIKEIRAGNTACALSFGGAVLGFCLPLASSIASSVSLPDFALWGLAAALVQILVYLGASRLIRNASAELAAGNTAVGTLFAALALSVGLINAACLT
ncbi:putative membrane protein [Neisseria sp. HSC-16F19]|nr:DUF350 domain-containing protein [Neisseria sp. HSC-16F19]MCP2041378.1 putative membrane protein [Neisseria sp. HSC-16F19]